MRTPVGNAVERAVGLWLHRLVVRNGGAHAELLNQYRSSEDFARRFPRSVCAPLLAGDEPLKAKYVKHQADEERHEALYAARIRELGGQPAPVAEQRDYLLQVWREACAAGVGIPYARFSDTRSLDRTERMRLWAVQTVVEERGLVEMALHRQACERELDARTVALLDLILPDERHHAAYSRRALDDAGSETSMSADESIGACEAPALLAVMRQVEERAFQRVTAALLVELRAGPLAEVPWMTGQALGLIAFQARISLRRSAPRGPSVPLEAAPGAW